MSRVWLTARFEARSHLGRRSFWLTTFVLPAAVVIVVLLVHAFMGDDRGPTLVPSGEQGRPIGYVDASGLLDAPPIGLPPGLVNQYQSEAAASEALLSGKIDRYYVVAPDYLESGRLSVVERRYRPLRALEGNELITYVLNAGITGDETLAALLLDPTPVVESSALAPTGARPSGEAAGLYLLPYLLMFILYLALAMTSGFMLQSVSKEKENRTAEMLLVSVSPRQLMFGKILGLSAVGLLQVAIWIAAFFGVLSTSGGLFGLDIRLDGETAARVIPWTIAYFLLGYLLYASAYATLGVLAPTLRDANHFVYIAIIPLVIPLLFNSIFATEPNGALATTLSLVPFTSPVAMAARQGGTVVAWWQSLAGLVALGLFAYGFVLAAAKLFRAENILSSRALTWQRLKRELRLAGAESTAGPRQPASRGPVVTSRQSRSGDSDRPGSVGRVRGAGAGAGAKPGTGKYWPAGSKQKAYLSGAVALVVIAIGIFEYVRGGESGIILIVVGAATAFSAYRRYRKS